MKYFCNFLKRNCGCRRAVGRAIPTTVIVRNGGSAARVEVRSTTTVEPQQKARVECSYKKNVAYLDFFIPKGDCGETEKISAGIVQKVNADEPAQVLDRLEQGVHFLDFKIPAGERGVTGEPGPVGERGPAGEKGATGERGLAGPKGEQGDPGVPETFTIDETITLGAGESAEVQDDFDGGVHYLTFYIPKGEKGELGPQGDKGEPGIKGDKGDTGAVGPKGDAGEKGDKGDTGPRGLPGEIGISEVITIDGTETLDAGEKAEVQDDFDRNIHHLTFYIPKGDKGERGDTGETGPKGETGQMGAQGLRGDTGPKGEVGPAGPPGATPNINATVANVNSQTIYNSRALTFGTTVENNAMRIEENAVIVRSSGTYLISFSINNGSSASAGENIGVAVNGTIIEASRRPLTASTNTSATLVKRLQDNDRVTVVPTINSDKTLYASGAPSVMLTIVKLA